MRRSGEFKRGPGLQTTSISNNNTMPKQSSATGNSLMMRTAQTYQNHQSTDYPTNATGAQKAQGQKFVNIAGGAYGSSLTEIQSSSSKAYTGQQSMSTNNFIDSGTNSS